PSDLLLDGGALAFAGAFDVAVGPLGLAGEVGLTALGRLQFQGTPVQVLGDGLAFGRGHVGAPEAVVEFGEPPAQRGDLDSEHGRAFDGLLQPFEVDLGGVLPRGEGDPDGLRDLAEDGGVDPGGARGVAQAEVEPAQSADAAFDGCAVA